MSKNYAFFPSIIQHPKLTGHVQFMSDFSFRHLVYHVSPDWWCCCPFTSRSSRRIDFTEKETLYSKTSWDPGEISLLQVRETYKSSQKKFSKPVRDPGKVLHYYTTLYLRASKNLVTFFFQCSIPFFLYHNGLICCQCWFRHEWEKKRRGKLFVLVSILNFLSFQFSSGFANTVTIFAI